MHRVGEGDEIVAQLSIGDAAFWVTAASSTMKRFSPRQIGGTTSRMLLVVDDPPEVVAPAGAAGATEASSVGGGHGRRFRGGIDPLGPEWGGRTPLRAWPPP